MADTDSLFTADCRLEPYWWRAAPHAKDGPNAMPADADVAIVGSGITGLVTAIYLAQAGRKVVVFDAGEPGYGASSRNAGYVGRTLKHTFGELTTKLGLDHAIRTYRELMAAFQSVRETIETLGISCFYRKQGRFLMATSPAMYEAMVREFELRAKHLGEPFEAVSRNAQAREIDTPLYFGGVRIADHAGLHPGLYHQGLLTSALRLGVTVCGFTKITAISQIGGKAFKLAAAHGSTEARQVLVATNGYTGDLIPWLKRRVIPFDAYMIATEQLDAAQVAKLLPADRTYIDWNFNVDFIRRAPDDARRIVFGGLTGEHVTDLRAMAQRLHARLTRVLPGIGKARIDNVWTGRCAGTLDLNPHFGVHDGIHYALGYCFAGVPMGTYFGIKVAQRLLGQEKSSSVFSEKTLPSHPLYWGNPWFVPHAIRFMSRHDR